MTTNPEGPRTLMLVRQLLNELRFPVALSGTPASVKQRDSIRLQLEDYLLPRIQNLGAPALAVLGGSTGAGKSTLLNSLLGDQLSPAGPIRPTTRSPILVSTEVDSDWFATGPVLPGLRRVQANSPAGQPGTISLATVQAHGPMLPGFALIDAPDIDSFADTNRALGQQLLDAADMWVFVTTAARYADLAAWNVLEQAAQRNASVTMVLNRVPQGVEAEVAEDLRELLAARGLSQTQVFTIPECELQDGLLPREVTVPLAAWLQEVAQNEESRRQVVQQTLRGALGSLAVQLYELGEHRTQQEATLLAWSDAVSTAYNHANQSIIQAVGHGQLLRAEVLSRWQDVVGSSDMVRLLEEWVGGTRDRVSAWLRGRPSPAREIEDELTGGLVTVMVEQETATSRALIASLRTTQGGSNAFDQRVVLPDSDESRAAAVNLVRQWQRDLIYLIGLESPRKRQRARLLSLGLNTVTVALMLAIFASTGGLLGGEVAVAGGSALLGQKLLETLFGDQAVRNLSQQGETLLQKTVEDFLAPSRARFENVITTMSGGPSGAELTAAAQQVERLTNELG